MLPLLLLLLGAAIAEEIPINQEQSVQTPQQQQQQQQHQQQIQQQYREFSPQYVYGAAARNDLSAAAPAAPAAPEESSSWDNGRIIATGPWVTVPNQSYRPGGLDPYNLGGSVGFGFDTQSLVTWGLGAVILLLLISTAVQLFQRVLPSVREMYESASSIEGARSLETVNNIAQFALEAMEKYEKMNE